MRKVAMFLALAMALTTFPLVDANAFAYAEGSATISSQTGLTAEAGSTITVPINISDNPGIMGLGLNVTYDEEVLTPQTVETTSISTGENMACNDTIETSKDNSFRIIWAGGENMTQNGTMFNVTFKVSDFAEGNTEIQLSYSKPDTFNEDFEDVTLNCSPVTINVTPKAAAVTTIKSSANQTVNAGEEIAVPILIDNVDKAAAVSFDLDYDSEVFGEPTNVTNGLGTCGCTGSEGQLHVDAAQIDTTVASGTLCTMTFKTAQYKSGNYVFDLSSSTAATEDFRIKVTNPAAGENAIVYGKNVSLNDSELTVDVGIKNNHGIAAFRIFLTYDKDVLTPVSVTKNSALSGSFGDSVANADGSFYALWFAADDFTRDDTLFTAKFTVKNGATGTTQIELGYDPDDTCDENGNDVLLTMENIEASLSNTADAEAAASVETIINNMDPTDADSVAAAREAYDALTDAQKALVDPNVLKKLTDAEEAIADAEAAASVETIINNMDPTDADSVAAAREAYDALTDAQKALVDPNVLKKLTDAEEAIADAEAAASVETIINNMDPTDADSVAAAREAYDALTDAQKALVDSDVLKKLTDAEEAIADAEAAASVETIINNMDPTDADSVAAAREAYDALTDAQKALVDSDVLKKLTDAEEAFADAEAAANVETIINNMDPTDADSVAAAREAYDALTDAQKALVDSDVLKKLTDAEEAFADAEAAANVETIINNMDPTDADSVAAAREAYDALTDAQKALVDPDVLKKLTDAEEAIESAKIDIKTIPFDPLPSLEWDGTPYEPCYFSMTYKLDEGYGVLRENVDYQVTYRDNIEIGTGTAVVTGIGKYKNTVELSFKITPIFMNYLGIYFSVTNPTYNGKAQTPKAVFSGVWKELMIAPPPTESEYTMTFTTDHKSVGNHKVTIKFSGHYTGTVEKDFKINPKGTKLSKLVRGKKSMTVKWKKQAAKMPKTRITGYQIRYSLKSNMKKSKMVKVKGYKKTSKKIKKLKAKKKYYVQIRTYTTIKGKTFYSPWSKKKAVKVR